MRTSIGILFACGLAFALAAPTLAVAQNGRGAQARQQAPPQQSGQVRVQPQQQPPRQARQQQVPTARQRAKAEAEQQATRGKPSATATKMPNNPRAQRMAQLRAEMIKATNEHVDRTARLERMRQLAQGNEQALQKLRDLQLKQNRLHEERMKKLDQQRGEPQGEPQKDG
jgi:hypothetical protein